MNPTVFNMRAMDLKILKGIKPGEHLKLAVNCWLNNKDFAQETWGHISGWDVSEVTNMRGMFNGASSFNEDISGWDVSKVTDMRGMFNDASSFNQPLNKWVVSKVTDMFGIFNNASSFNEDISGWDVSEVTEMRAMFYGAIAFNKDISEWDVSEVTDMRAMFNKASSFNQPLNKWDVSKVTDIRAMFSGASSFNQDISEWNVGSVTNMIGMFTGARSFNQPLNTWDVSQVTDMREMFAGARSFNQPLNTWVVSQVTNMSAMFLNASSFNQDIFFNASSFNQDISGWTVSNVTNMSAMFAGARSFNQPLNTWDVSNVTNMTAMFNNATAFNQPLNDWNIGNVDDMINMFANARAFNQDLSSWNVMDVNTEDMFLNVNMNEGFKPRFMVHDVLEVHRGFGKINVAELIMVLSSNVNDKLPTNIDMRNFISNKLTSFISTIKNDELRTQLTKQLFDIFQMRLNRLEYSEISPPMLQAIYYALLYVEKQSLSFKEDYMTAFVTDCVGAYEGEGQAAMSCTYGILERMVLSLVQACGFQKSSGTENEIKENEMCDRITDIIENNREKMIPIAIQEWYKLHSTPEGKFPPEMEKVEKQADLKAFLLERFPGSSELIENKIKEIADNIGYESGDFAYGGGVKRRRKTKKTNTKKQQKMNTKKQQKMNTKKNKK